MASIVWGIGLGAKVETVPGTAETAPTGALTLANGIVLGDAGSGEGNSGISFSLERIDRDVAPVTGSFTAQNPTFIRRELSKLSITVQGKGSGATSSNPTVNADFNQATDYPGLDALLQSAGLAGAAIGSGVGWCYKPAAAAPTTVWVWVGEPGDTEAVLYTMYNCTSKMTMALKPGDVPLWTFEIEGTVSSHSAAITMPTFDYGTAASTAAPVIAEAAHSFGISAESRGFTDMTITIDNAIEDVPDSNAVGGITKRQTGRTITASVTLYASATDEDYEDTALIATAAPTDDLVFRAGTGATGTATAAVNWNVKFNNPVVKSNEVVQIGPSVGRAVGLQATGTGTTEALSEFNLIFY